MQYVCIGYTDYERVCTLESKYSNITNRVLLDYVEYAYLLASMDILRSY